MVDPLLSGNYTGELCGVSDKMNKLFFRVIVLFFGLFQSHIMPAWILIIFIFPDYTNDDSLLDKFSRLVRFIWMPLTLAAYIMYCKFRYIAAVDRWSAVHNRKLGYDSIKYQ